HRPPPRPVPELRPVLLRAVRAPRGTHPRGRMRRVLAALLRERPGLLRRSPRDTEGARAVRGATMQVPGRRRLRVRDGLVVREALFHLSSQMEPALGLEPRTC